MKTVVLNGLSIEVFKTKVKIYDPLGNLEEKEAHVIIHYLYNEGFIEKDEIICEIISDVDENMEGI